MTELERAREFVRALPLGLAEEIVACRFGQAAFVHSLPRVYWINLISVDPGERATADELAAEADRMQEPAGLLHRMVSIYDDLGYEVETDFRGLEWTVHRHLVMTYERPAELAAGQAEEVTADEIEPVWADGIRESPYGRDEEVVRQLVEAQHRRRRAVDVRYFAARAGHEIASYCELFSDGKTARSRA